MSHQRCHSTSLVERVAGLRKVKVEQRLADAVAQENDQRQQVQGSTDRVLTTERALSAVTAAHRIDAARMGLYQQLLALQDEQLGSDQEVLQVREHARVAQASELERVTHYHEQASRRARDALRERRASRDRKTAESLVESWILRRVREKSDD